MCFRLADLARTNARQLGERVALTADGRTVTYAELDARSNRAARALTECGVAAGQRVAWVGKNSPEFFDLLLGAAKIRAAVAPVNTRLMPNEQLAVIADSEAPVVVLGQESSDLRAEIDTTRRVLCLGDDYEDWLASQPASDPLLPGEETDVVLQLYTSGTTGVPKGVMLDNKNIGALVQGGGEWSLDGDSVALVAMPLFHIGGSGFAMLGLAYGAQLVLVADIDPPALLATMEDKRVTNAFLVPAVLQFLTQVPGAADRDWSALRSIAYGASPITTSVLSRVMETFRAPLFQVYGATETSGAITQLDPEDHTPGGPRAHLMRSAGRPYPWVELKTVDPATGGEQPRGEVGEIWIRSQQVTSGYWKRRDETSSQITPDGWFKTGDAGYLDEHGYLFLTDRIKDMIVTGAENVYPIEVEEILSGHPDVEDVAVIGVPDQKWGETVKAVVVCREGAELAEQDLLDWARTRIAGFKRPRTVTFVDTLPRGATGKVLKKELRKPYWEDAEQRQVS